MTLALVVGAAIGVALGLLGGGGSIVTVPALVYAAGVRPADAVVMSLAIVGGTSAFGAALKARAGLLHARAALYFAGTGAVGSALGSRLTHLVPDRWLMLAFGALMLAVGASMALRSDGGPPDGAACRPARCAGAGAGVGVVTGFLGVGGGFLIVPAMVRFGGLPMKTAVGTSLAVIAANSFAGLIGHGTMADVDWSLTAAILAVAACGMLAGLRLTPAVPAAALSRGFGWTVLCLGIAVVVTAALG